MAETLEFHFDFISPYGYFAAREIEGFAARLGLELEWRVMLLGVSVLKEMKLPPMAERPLVGDYHLRHAIPRYAALSGLTLNRDLYAPPPSPVLAARLFCLLSLAEPGAAADFARACMAAYWAGEDVLTDGSRLMALAEASGGDWSTLHAGLDNGLGTALLRESVEISLKKGVFGSPMFLIGDEPFHGLDSLPVLERWLTKQREMGR